MKCNEMMAANPQSALQSCTEIVWSADVPCAHNMNLGPDLLSYLPQSLGAVILPRLLVMHRQSLALHRDPSGRLLVLPLKLVI